MSEGRPIIMKYDEWNAIRKMYAERMQFFANKGDYQQVEQELSRAKELQAVAPKCPSFD